MTVNWAFVFFSIEEEEEEEGAYPERCLKMSDWSQTAIGHEWKHTNTRRSKVVTFSFPSILPFVLSLSQFFFFSFSIFFISLFSLFSLFLALSISLSFSVMSFDKRQMHDQANRHSHTTHLLWYILTIEENNIHVYRMISPQYRICIGCNGYQWCHNILWMWYNISPRMSSFRIKWRNNEKISFGWGCSRRRYFAIKICLQWHDEEHRERKF